MNKAHQLRVQRNWMWGSLLLVLIVAVFFRFWQIADLPPGLFGDEAADGLDALDVLAGRGQVFFPTNFGREGLHMWIVALSIRLFGVSPLALRLPSALAGVITALGTLWLGYELFIHRRDEHTSRTSFWLGTIPLSWLIPPLAALYLSTSYWHVHFSRFGIRGIFSTMMLALTAAALWRGLNLHRWRWFALSGLFMGLGTHFYTASRFVPLFFAVFLGGWLLLSLMRAHPTERIDSVVHFSIGVVVLFAVSALVFAPLGYYFLTHPGSFSQRASEVSVFQQGFSWEAIQTIAQATFANLAQFIWPGHGDLARFYNLPGRAVFDPITAILALVGLVVSLRKWRYPVFAFLLLWLLIMASPSFIAVDRYPTLPRLLGVIPGIFFFPAIGLVTLLEQMLRWRRYAPRMIGVLSVVLPLLALGTHASVTYHDYFQVWGPDPATADAFEQDMVDAWRWLQGNPPPADVYLSSDLYKHPTFMFLYEQTPTTEFFDHVNPRLHWFDARRAWFFTQNEGQAILLLGNSALPPDWLISRLHLQTQPVASGYAFVAKTPVTIHPSQNIPFSDTLTLVDQVVIPPRKGAQEGVIMQIWRSREPESPPGQLYQIQSALANDQGQQWVQVSDDMAIRATEWPRDGLFATWQTLSWPDGVEPTHTVLRLVPHNQPPLRPPHSDAEGWILLPLRTWDDLISN
ncbi:MAG: hypothetical protein GXP38_05380 [Chloroflexi bacterium]|nr:hypothetical protein [Chloroflexota bacterium]